MTRRPRPRPRTPQYRTVETHHTSDAPLEVLEALPDRAVSRIVPQRLRAGVQRLNKDIQRSITTRYTRGISWSPEGDNDRDGLGNGWHAVAKAGFPS